MSSFFSDFADLKEFSEMPSSEKLKTLQGKEKEIANSVILQMRFYEGGNCISKNLYPFFTKSVKETIYQTYEHQNKADGYIGIVPSINIYRLLKNEDFSDKLLKDTIRKTLTLKTKSFSEKKDIISTFYAATLFEKGNNICKKNFTINDYFCFQLQKKGELSLLPTISSIVPFEDNIKRMSKLKIEFSAKDEIKKFNTLAEEHNNHAFIKDMALEAMGLAISKEDNLLRYEVNPEYHDKIKEFQRKAHGKMLSKIFSHPVDADFTSK